MILLGHADLTLRIPPDGVPLSMTRRVAAWEYGRLNGSSLFDTRSIANSLGTVFPRGVSTTEVAGVAVVVGNSQSHVVLVIGE